MKPVIKIFVAAVLIASAGYASANPRPTVKSDTFQTVDRHLSGFNSIKIGGTFEVHITQGPVESVKFEASADIVDRIVTEVDRGVLKIHNKYDNWGWGFNSWYSDRSIWHNHKKIVVYVTAKDLGAITVSGSGDVIFSDRIATNSLKLLVRGSGSVQGKVEVKRLESHISGSGNIKLSGNAENSSVRVIGSGKFTGRDLITLNSAVHVSGSGNAEINANDKVDASVNGSGDVSYTGAAKIVNSKTSGSGGINRF